MSKPSLYLKFLRAEAPKNQKYGITEVKEIIPNFNNYQHDYQLAYKLLFSANKKNEICLKIADVSTMSALFLFLVGKILKITIC